MFRRPYNSTTIFSPSWLVKKIGEREYKKVFAQYAPENILDIGCGAGEKKSVIPEKTKYLGIDHLSTLHSYSNIDIFASAYQIPLKDRLFDFAFCTGVLEHLEEPEIAIREAYRILKPNGYALYTIPFIWHLHEEPRDFYRYTKYGIQHLFKKAGFEIIKITPLSGFWITFGSEWNYYINLLSRIAILNWGIKLIIMFNNLMFLLLETIDRKLNRASDRWTWMYLVIARKKINE